MSERNIILKNIGLLSSWITIERFINMFYFIILTKILNPSEYGLLGVSLSVMALVGVLNLGLNTAVMKYIAERQEKDVFIKGVKLAAVIGVVAGIFLFLFSDKIANLYSKPIAIYLKILSILLFLNSINGAISHTYLGTKNMRYYIMQDVILNASKIFFVVIFLYLGFRIIGVIYGMILSVMITLILSVQFIKKISFSDTRFRYRQLINYWSKSLSLSLINVVQPELIIFFLGIYTSLNEIGYFLFMRKIILFVVTMFSDSLPNVLLPYFSEQHSKNNMIYLGKLISSSVRATVYTVVPLSIVSVTLAKTLLLFYREYAPASNLIVPFAILGFFMAVGSIASAVLKATNNLDSLIKLGLMSISTTSLGFVFIPKVSSFEAVVLLVFVYCIFTVYAFKIISEKLKLEISVKPMKEDFELIMTVVRYGKARIRWD